MCVKLVIYKEKVNRSAGRDFFVIIWLPTDSFQPYFLFCIERKDVHEDDKHEWTQSLCYDIPVPIYGEIVIKPSQWSVCGMQIKQMCHVQLH